MEVQLAYSAIIITTFFLLLSLIKMKKRSKLNTKLPPGPWKLPIIGSMHHLATGGSPHHTLSKLSKKHGPLMHLQLGQNSTVVVSSPQMAKLILKTHDLAFGGRHRTLATEIIFYNNTEIIFAPANDHWRQMRKICVVELLSNARVKSFSLIREDEVSNLVSFIKGSVIGSPIDLSAQVYSLTSSITCRAAFGEKFQGQSSLLSLVDGAVSLTGGFNLGDFFPSVSFVAVVTGMKKKMQNIHKKIDIMLDDIIKKRREYNEMVRERGEGKNDKEDLLDVLLRLRHENEQKLPLTDYSIKAVILELFAAGAETSGAVIEWAMLEMIKNPRVMEKAQSEVRRLLNEIKESDTSGLHYLSCVIKETLRLHPPAPLLPRECTEACEINGYTIPAKTKVIVNAWAIGRDPDFWEDAEKFIPERFENNMSEYFGNNFEYMPFGAGRRICPGISFGLSMVELVLTQLLYHFNWKLPNQIKPEELDMTETTGLSVKRRIPLHLIAESTNC